MRIVSRKEFLKLPIGTIFTPVGQQTLLNQTQVGVLGDTFIKGRSFPSDLAGPLDCFDFTDLSKPDILFQNHQSLMDMIEDPALSFDIQLSMGMRSDKAKYWDKTVGCLNHFLIWEKADLIKLQTVVTNAVNML